jgi:uncharacterized protein YcnI
VHRLTRLGTALAAVGIATVAAAVPAWAHVTVDPSTAKQGDEITLGFRVPNEEPNASTVKLQIIFPSAHPVLGVDPQDAPGWTSQITTLSLNPPVQTDDGPVTSYVRKVDWSGGHIAPGHFQEFYVLAQRLPTDTTSVTFKALQTYSDGNVVRWIQTTTPGAPAPDHPAPVLTLTPPAATATDPSGAATKTRSSTSYATGVIGIILGAIGIAGAAAALVLVTRRQNA